jgi:hypothetical protein
MRRPSKALLLLAILSVAMFGFCLVTPTSHPSGLRALHDLAHVEREFRHAVGFEIADGDLAQTGAVVVGQPEITTVVIAESEQASPITTQRENVPQPLVPRRLILRPPSAFSSNSDVPTV